MNMTKLLTEYPFNLIFSQKLPIANQTSPFLLHAMTQLQDSGFYRILTNGSVILATPERMFS